MGGVWPDGDEAEAHASEGRAALHRAARVAAWPRPRPILEAALLAASLVLCAAVLGGLL